MLTNKFRSTLLALPSRFFARRTKRKNLGEPRLVPEYDPETAIRLAKAYSYRAFPESIDLCIRLGINPKRSEMNIRGTCVLPHGVGRTERICFVGGDAREEERARGCGITIIADAKLLEEIKNGVINFDKLYATTSGLAKLKPFARILGPKGLFPNAKVKTLVESDDIGGLIRNDDGRRAEGQG